MKNKNIIILIFLFVLCLIFVSFYDVIQTYYVPDYIRYNHVKEECPGDSEWCSDFHSNDEVNVFLDEHNPKNRFDVITLSIYVLRNTESMNLFLIISPMIMILLVVFSIHSEINSGYFENILTRSNYIMLIKKYVMIVAKMALLLPFIYILVHIISCFITGFNFNFNSFYIEQYGIEIYNHFFRYSLIFLFAQYILYFGYGLIGIIMSFKCKSKVISIILGYIYFIVLDLVYMIISALFFRDVLGMPSRFTEFFNLLGYYWFFDSHTIYWIAFSIVLSVVLINMLVIYFYVGKKEKAVVLYEKQVS